MSRAMLMLMKDGLMDNRARFAWGRRHLSHRSLPAVLSMREDASGQSVGRVHASGAWTRKGTPPAASRCGVAEGRAIGREHARRAPDEGSMRGSRLCSPSNRTTKRQDPLDAPIRGCAGLA